MGRVGWNLVVGKAFSNGDCRVRDRDRCARPLLVAAGVVLRRYQDQAGAGGLGLRRTAERVENADDGGVSGKNAETN